MPLFPGRGRQAVNPGQVHSSGTGTCAQVQSGLRGSRGCWHLEKTTAAVPECTKDPSLNGQHEKRPRLPPSKATAKAPRGRALCWPLTKQTQNLPRLGDPGAAGHPEKSLKAARRGALISGMQTAPGPCLTHARDILRHNKLPEREP